MAEADLATLFEGVELFPEHGRVCELRSGEIVADGPLLPVGAHCLIGEGSTIAGGLRAQVIAVTQDRISLLPFGQVGNIKIGDKVLGCPDRNGVAVGEAFAGRAVDGLGRTIDEDGPVESRDLAESAALPVLDRITPSQPFLTAIRAIDGLLTIGRGQRIGIFAASGVGKTSLMEHILRQSDYDRAVVCLVGERGREVEALWREICESPRRNRTTLVAATAEESAPMRRRAPEQALALCEYWRGRGEHVLLIVDSVTRLAMALREIGLVAGEPPTARSYTPNVYRELPALVERCGAARRGGSITAIFTILSETDEVDDPIVELMKSLLDGHIVLSRRLAQASHYPAIDIGASLSRLFDRLTDEQHGRAAARARAALAEYEEARILIESGMYKSGSNREIDHAIALRGRLRQFLRQAPDETANWNDLRATLIAVVDEGGVRA